MLLCCFYHVRGSAIMPSLLSFAGPLGWWGYISLFFCLFVDECFFFFFFLMGLRWPTRWLRGKYLFFFFFFFLHILLGTHSKYSVSVCFCPESVCLRLFICLSDTPHPPSLIRSQRSRSGERECRGRRKREETEEEETCRSLFHSNYHDGDISLQARRQTLPGQRRHQAKTPEVTAFE